MEAAAPPASALRDPARLAALRATALLDSPHEEGFDRLTKMGRVDLTLEALVAANQARLDRATVKRARRRLSRLTLDAARLPKEAARLYADVMLFPRPTKWLEVPWLLDLNEGIRAAKAENRPVLIWVSGDDPLERC